MPSRTGGETIRQLAGWARWWINTQIDRAVDWWIHRDDKRWDDWER